MNRSLAESLIPQEWKHATVTHVHKSDSRTNPANYRPISVLPVLSNILEGAVHKMVYMLWFNFILGLNFIFLCLKVIIIYYHTPKQTKIKIQTKDKIELQHIHSYSNTIFSLSTSPAFVVSTLPARA